MRMRIVDALSLGPATRDAIVERADALACDKRTYLVDMLTREKKQSSPMWRCKSCQYALTDVGWAAASKIKAL